MHWPGLDNLQDYSFKDENGNYYLQSVDDDLATVILSDNCLHFRVQYWHFTGNKVGQWVAADQAMNLSTINCEDPNLQTDLQDDLVNQNQNYNQIGRISEKQKVYKMMYEYVKVEQIHSIA